jgi:hypothetical protein
MSPSRAHPQRSGMNDIIAGSAGFMKAQWSVVYWAREDHATG